MSLLAENGVEATVSPHACRDASGATVTGQAGSITTALFAPDGTSSAVVVTVAEIGSTGFYSASVTPNAVGNWLLRITNPAFPTADGQTTDYTLQVQAGVVAATAKDLTSRAKVKRRLWPELDPATTNTAFDTLIDTLVTEASNHIHDRLGRCLSEDTYTEYYDGTGLSYLQLRQGPLVSVTSVDYITYGGTTSRTETTDTVNEGDRLERGLRSEGWTLLGGLEMVAGFWLTGRRNVKVVYTAGYATIPESIVRAATELAVRDFVLRTVKGLQQESTENAITTVVPRTPAELAQLVDDAISPYRPLAYV